MTKVGCKAWRLCEVSMKVVFVEVYIVTERLRVFGKRPCLFKSDRGQLYLQAKCELVVKS